MRYIIFVLLFFSFTASAQVNKPLDIIKHGDTVFMTRLEATLVEDSSLRWRYFKTQINDSTFIDDSATYMFRFRRITTSERDSVQMSKFPNTAGYITSAALAPYQQTLVSGTNIKTLNGESLLGSTNIVISGAGPTRVFLPNDVINNNGVANTIADVTGLSFPVVANTTYQFKFFIVYNSAATTTGSRWSINGPAATFMNYTSNYTLTATSITNNQGLSSYNVPAASNASSLTTNNIAIITGNIRPSASGTVIARFASEILSSAITAVTSGKSYVEYQIIN